jgi:CheY-like chemotaxis protein
MPRNYNKEQLMRNVYLSVSPATLSHELKTPLTAILGLAEHLSRQQLTPEQRMDVNGIYEQGDRLLHAIDELLFEQDKKGNDMIINTTGAANAKINFINTTTKLPVLLIEDEPIIQRVHRMMLETLGFHVHVANDAEEALKLYSSHQYAAILTDINMPGMSGVEMSAEIRHIEKNEKPVPIIALTADITETTKAECLNAGIDEVATKPINIQQLQTLFLRFLNDST